MQNRFTRSVYVARVVSVLLAVVACKGDQGPAGPAGAPGATGAAGATGATGQSGVISTTVIIYSTSVTDNTPTAEPKQVRTFSSFTKLSANTKIRLDWNSHVYAVGNGFCQLQVRVDGVQPSANDFGATAGGILNGAYFPIATTNVISGLPAGSHTLSLWIRGVAVSQCSENLGNFDRAITITEF